MRPIQPTSLRLEASDAIVVGAGFYGLRVALFLRAQLGIRHVRVFEKESRPMERASYANQARVHNGYHYPRSILTAYRSRINFPEFVDEYREAIVDEFEHYYAIARIMSKVNAFQFETFCTRIGAFWQHSPKEVARLFHPARIERSYVVREPAFDSRILREILLDRVSSVGGIEINTNDEVTALAGISGQRIRVVASSGTYEADQVISAVYSRINTLHRQSGLDQFELQHEISEMALVQLPARLCGIGLTVMDGPFFSLMPFPSQKLHTMSHVRFTPQRRWREGTGRNEVDPHQIMRLAPDRTGFAAMLADVKRYVPGLASTVSVGSIREVKTVLAKSDLDDSRPILYRPDHGIPNYTCIMGGKLDNIYDVLAELETTNVSG